MAKPSLPRWMVYTGGAALALGVLGFVFRRRIAMALPTAFNLIKRAYSSVESWAADRGQQIRDAFGVQKDTLRPEGSISSKTMSADEWNERKIQTLNAQYQPRFRAFMAEAQKIARSKGKELMIWDAARTLERQIELYKRGRTQPGTIVTYAIATSTGHIWGLAIDLTFRDAAGNPTFEELPAWYVKEVLPLAKKHGLESLYLKKGIDKPHIQVATAEATVTASAAKQIRADFPGLA